MRSIIHTTSQGRLHALEIGDPQAVPLLFMHGFPGCHAQIKFIDKFSHKYNVRALAFDRPGYAYSDAYTYKTSSIANFVSAVREFLEAEKIEKFYVIGVSGGNPYALAIAQAFSRRVIALGSICGLGAVREFPEAFTPFTKWGLWLAAHVPSSALQGLGDFILSNFSPEEKLDSFAQRLHPADRDILLNSEMRTVILESMQLARKQGAKGIVYDLKNYSSDWGVDYTQINCPYFLWHGEEDGILPVAMSRAMQKRIPHGRLKTFAGEGHYSVPVLRIEEILEDLLSVKA
jgi:pimeloyl-ACP methyl ester carboxylesterase